MRLHQLNSTDIFIDRSGLNAFMVVETKNRWIEAPNCAYPRKFTVRPERGRLLLMLTCNIFMAEQLPEAMASFRQQLAEVAGAGPTGAGTEFSLSHANSMPGIALPLGIDVQTIHPSKLARDYADHTAREEAMRLARRASRVSEAAEKNARLSRFDAALRPLDSNLLNSDGDVRLEREATRITFTLEAFERFTRQLQH